MTSLLICEGKTDAVLYGYYLIKKFNWSYLELGHRPKSLKSFDVSEDQGVELYQKDNRYLLIIAAGGASRFNEIWEKFKPLISDADERTVLNKVAIIRDRDNYDDSALISIFNDVLDISIIELNSWCIREFANDFGDMVKLEILPLVVPQDKYGALEDAIMDALSISNSYELIIEQSKNFVNETKNKVNKLDNEILSEQIMIPKAVLSSFISIVSPERLFDKVNRILLDYKWEDNEILNLMLKELESL